jgi:hypothetical protein
MTKVGCKTPFQKGGEQNPLFQKGGQKPLCQNPSILLTPQQQSIAVSTPV